MAYPVGGPAAVRFLIDVRTGDHRYADLLVIERERFVFSRLGGPGVLAEARRECGRMALRLIEREGIVFALRSSRLLVRTSPLGEEREDGPWLDAELFPPAPNETLARDVSRALADRDRAGEPRPEGWEGDDA